MDILAGVDLGSTAIKVVLTDGRQILWSGRTPTAPGQEKLAGKLMSRGLAHLGLGPGSGTRIAATGYGKGLYLPAEKMVDEISANAAGLFHLSRGQARSLINIGGQDVKIVRLDASGRVADFRMNDKCAAGTGRFFELAARLLDTPLEDFPALSQAASQEVTLNSTCAVFAESEMVSLMARGTEKGGIIKALHGSVAKRVASMLSRADLSEGVWLDGGPALNRALALALEDELMTEVFILEKPQYTVAFGAALSLN
ncbi:MAG: acyl-CoA dehydratase activase [Deltaproteobacteria bacterium]|jgi:predicted CoA-substrate-specific enzyme activase|nr:acyl-CoA dehydratase activase [Deltaproteobacteria bacterium]